MTFRQNTWGVCFRIYAFDLCVWIVLSCVFYVSVGIYVHIALHVWQIHYGVRLRTSASFRHVFRRFHMKWMPATVNAYFLHLTYLWPLRCVCSIDVVVSWGKHARTLTRAHTHWDTREGAVMATSVSLTLSSLLPTVTCFSLPTNWYHCRTQSSTASAPCGK